jgi:hypothetical protein
LREGSSAEQENDREEEEGPVRVQSSSIIASAATDVWS